MRLFFQFLCMLALLAGAGTLGQEGIGQSGSNHDDPFDRKLPNGKTQSEEILKADYEKSLKDAAELVVLSQSLQKELESGNSRVLSVSTLKDTEEIEKLAKRIHGRLRRF